jgi:hypothetical protein
MAQFQTRPNTFALFTNDNKKVETHPDHRGKGVLSGEVLDYIIQAYNAGETEIAIELATWVKDGKTGTFRSGKFSVPFRKEGNAGPVRVREDDDRPARSEDRQAPAPAAKKNFWD